jgi:ABC-type multidrug transport system ATPase subunit
MFLLGPAPLDINAIPSSNNVSIRVGIGSTIELAEGEVSDPGIIAENQPVLFRLIPKDRLPAHTAIKVSADLAGNQGSGAFVGCDAIPDLGLVATLYDHAPPPFNDLYFLRESCSVVYVVASFAAGAVMHNVSWSRVPTQHVAYGSTVVVDTHVGTSGLVVLYLDDDIRVPSVFANATVDHGGDSGTVSISVAPTRPVSPTRFAYAEVKDAAVTPDLRHPADFYVVLDWSLPNDDDAVLKASVGCGDHPIHSLPYTADVVTTDILMNSVSPVAFAVRANESLSAICFYGDSTVDSVTLSLGGTLPYVSYPEDPPVVNPHGVALPPMCAMMPQKGVDTLVVVNAFASSFFPNNSFPISFFGVYDQQTLQLPPPTAPGKPSNVTVPVSEGTLSLRVDMPDNTTHYLVTFDFHVAHNISYNASITNLAPWGLFYLDDDQTVQPSHLGFMGVKVLRVGEPAFAMLPRGVRGGMTVLGSLTYGDFAHELVNMSLTVTVTPIVSVEVDKPPRDVYVSPYTSGFARNGFASVMVPDLLPSNVVEVFFTDTPVSAIGCVGSLAVISVDPVTGKLPRIQPVQVNEGRSMLITPTVSDGGMPVPNSGVGYVWFTFDGPTFPSSISVQTRVPKECGDVLLDDNVTELVVACTGMYTLHLPRSGPVVVRVDTVEGGRDYPVMTSFLRMGPLGYFPNALGGLLAPTDWIYVPSGETLTLLRSNSTFLPSPVKLRFTIEQEVELCDPVLRCSGNGHCMDLPGDEVCDCFDGFGYDFSGPTCSIRGRGKIWALLSFVLVVLVIIVGDMVRRSGRCAPGRRGDETTDKDDATGDDMDAMWTPLINAERGLDEDIEWTFDPVRIDLAGVGVVVKDRKTTRLIPLLTEISVGLEPRTVTAIMGPSGSGKTTLLRLLAGWLSPTAGTILLNGDAALSPKMTLGDVVSLGFVPQEDILTPQLTVREALDHAARLRLPGGGVATRRATVIESVLETLDLVSVADAVIGDIGRSTLSGGQRRRVSIGMELVSRCSVLLLDEPTSGLSSLGSLQVMQVLSKIAASGVTVVAVIHQPRREIMNYVDKLVVLADGRLRYASAATSEAAVEALDGRNANVEALLESGPSVNVADVVIDFVNEFPIVTPERVAAQERRMRTRRRENLRCAVGATGDVSSDDEGAVTSVVLEPVLAQPRKPHRLGWFDQMALFARRTVRQTLRSPGTLAVLYGLTVSIALLLGGVFSSARYVGPPQSVLVTQCPHTFLGECMLNQEDSYLSQGAVMTFSLGFVAAAAFLSTFGGIEGQVFLRESRTGCQSDSAYFVGKLVGETVHLLCAPLVFTAFFAFLSVPTISTATLYTVCLGIFVVASGIAHVASINADQSRALIYATVFVAVSVLTGGVSPSQEQIEAGLGTWIGNTIPKLSFAHWTIEGFYLGVVKPYRDVYNTTAAIEVVGMSHDEHELSLVMPFAIGALLQLVAMITLSRKNKLEFS